MNNSLLLGEVVSGSYTIVENSTFAVRIPAEILPNTNFSINVTYADYFSVVDESSQCVLQIGGSPYNFTPISLPGGTYNYNVTCNTSGLPFKQELGVFNVVNFTGFSGKTTYEPFRFTRENTNCAQCQLSLNNTALGNFSLSDTCQSPQIQVSGLRYVANVSCPSGDNLFNITLTRGYTYWSGFEEIFSGDSKSVPSDEVLWFSFVNSSNAISQFNISETFNLLGKNPKHLSFSSSQNRFYAISDIQNNGSISEIRN
ncbi:MAG: hypothetical protein ACFE0O_13020 [Opitutales bacterium]